LLVVGPILYLCSAEVTKWVGISTGTQCFGSRCSSAVVKYMC
jgi:hypothetical protein